MHEAGRDLRTMKSRVTLEDYDFDTGDNPVRPGVLRVRRGIDGEADAIHVVLFGRQDRDADGELGPFVQEKLEYLLADGRLVDRNHRSRTEVSRVLPPEQADRDLLALGEGPFPLPIGQEPAKVRELFELILLEPGTEAHDELQVPAPEDSQRVRLVPKPGSELSDAFQRIEIDVDPTSGFPKQVTTLDGIGVNLRITSFAEMKINENLDEAVSLEEVDLSNWNVSVENLRE